MNRGLGLSILLLLLAVLLVGGDSLWVRKSIEKNEDALVDTGGDRVCTQAEIERVNAVFRKTRICLAVSVPEGYLNEYEEAIAALTASVKSEQEEAYVAAHAEARAALEQIKRSALFSVGQIF